MDLPRKQQTHIIDLQVLVRHFYLFLSQEVSLVYCNDIDCVLETLDQQDESNEWQMCFSFSKLVLKTVSSYLKSITHAFHTKKNQYAPPRKMYLMPYVIVLALSVPRESGSTSWFTASVFWIVSGGAATGEAITERNDDSFE